MNTKKIIAVWGSPHSGRTTFATKLAQAVYDGGKSSVIVLYADSETPVLPVLFPNLKREAMLSVGAALAGVEVTREETVRQLMTLRGRPNLGYLGYRDGENMYSYPSFGEEKARDLLSVLSDLADCVIVDCTDSLKNPLSGAAVKAADETVRLCSPDLKSFSFMLSQLPLYADPAYGTGKHVQGLNVPDADLYMPMEEAKAMMSDPRFVIPYSREVKAQMLEGRLSAKCSDRKYNSKIRAVAEKLTQ